MNLRTKRLLQQATLITFLFSSFQQTALAQSEWTESDVKAHAQAYNSPDQWDQETFAQEQEIAPILVTLDVPLRLTPFPVPEYDSPGNGNRGVSAELNGLKLTGQAAMVAKNDYNGHLFTFDDDAMAAYFILVVPDDGMEADDPVIASSRNHPNYIAQGSVNHTSNTRVDWVAVQSASGYTHAVVNGRFFDLSAGYVVLANPMQDGTIRFHQLNMQPINNAEWDTFVNGLSEIEEVKIFYSQNQR